MMRLIPLTLFTLTIGWVPTTASAAGQWAILIGVQEHDNPRYSLRYPVRDVTTLHGVLDTRAGIDPGHTLIMTDDSPKSQQPTLANIRQQVPAFLKRAEKGDRVLLFFSGHGVADGGKTYLVPRDVNATRIGDTALPADELHEWLTNCNAGIKFLILDCCHSGSKSGVNTLGAGKVAEAVDLYDVPGAIVLASCKSREVSLEWAKREQGLFTYWLCRALEGAATNGDGKVTLAEVSKYVRERVTALSLIIAAEEKVEGFRGQNPEHYGNIPGDPVLLALSPEGEESFCRRVAEDLDSDIRRQGLKSIGVIEFFLPYGGHEEMLGRATLPGYLTEQVRDRLKVLSGGAYEVRDRDRMAAATKDLLVSEIRKPTQLQQMKQRGDISAVVFGVIRELKDKYSLKCSMVDTSSGDTLGEAGGTLRLKDVRIGDLPHSFDATDLPDDVDPYDENRVNTILSRTREGHPLLRKDFPFKIKFSVNGKEAPSATSYPKVPGLEKQSSESRIAVRKGDELEIGVTNMYTQGREPKRVGMRLLLDGINSLGQKRTLLDKGGMWILDPNKPYTIGGYHIRDPNAEPGQPNFEKRPFVFVDVSESVAARENFTDQIGVISFAFFEDAEDNRAIAVGQGSNISKQTLTEKEFRSGRCLAVVQVRYVEAK